MRGSLVQSLIEVYDQFEANMDTEGMTNVDNFARFILTDDEYMEFTEGYSKDGEPLIGWESQL